MAASDFFSSAKFLQGFPPEDVAAGAAGDGTEIDTKGYRWAIFVLQTGVMDAASTYDMQIEETDVTGFGGTVSDITGALVQTINTDDNSTFVVAIDLQQADRYLRVKDFTVGGVASAAISVTVILSQAKDSTGNAPNATVLTW